MPTAEQRREVMGRWRGIAGGMDGERITHLDRPDDPVAYKLPDAAGAAIARGELQGSVNILMLIARDYLRSQEAALARQALDQIKRQADRGR